LTKIKKKKEPEPASPYAPKIGEHTRFLLVGWPIKKTRGRNALVHANVQELGAPLGGLQRGEKANEYWVKIVSRYLTHVETGTVSNIITHGNFSYDMCN
jgi:hypothetical protein